MPVSSAGTPDVHPLVSVCIPAFNASMTIAATLDSLLGQDYPRIDIVVSDNQSTDGTRAIVETYADRGVRYVLHDRPRPDWAAGAPDYVGGFLNWEHALNCGRGELLCLYHADDLFDPGMISAQVELMLRNPGAAAAFTMLATITVDGTLIENGVTKLPPPLKGKEIFEFTELVNAILRYGNFIATPSVMLRAGLLSSIGGFDECRFQSAADLEMWLRIARQYPIGIVPRPLLKYRIHENQWYSRYSKGRTTRADFFAVLDDVLRDPRVGPRIQSGSLRRYVAAQCVDDVLCSVHLLSQGRTEEARARLRQSLRISRLWVARAQPRRLFGIVIGYALRLAIELRCGPVVGRFVHRLYKAGLRKRRQAQARRRA